MQTCTFCSAPAELFLNHMIIFEEPGGSVVECFKKDLRLRDCGFEPHRSHCLVSGSTVAQW